MVRYYYPIFVYKYEDDYFLAQSPEFPICEAIDRSIYDAIIIEVDSIVSEVNKYLRKNYKLPKPKECLSEYSQLIVHILPIIIDEPAYLEKVGEFIENGLKIIYLPQSNLYTSDSDENQKLSSNPYTIPFNLPLYRPPNQYTFEETLLSLIKKYNPEYVFGVEINDAKEIKKFTEFGCKESLELLRSEFNKYQLRDILKIFLPQYELLVYFFTHTDYELSHYVYHQDFDFRADYHNKQTNIRTRHNQSIQHLFEVAVTENPAGSSKMTVDSFELLYVYSIIFSMFWMLKYRIKLSLPIAKLTISQNGIGSVDDKINNSNLKINRSRDILLMRNGSYKKYSDPIDVFNLENERNSFNSVCICEFGLSYVQLEQFHKTMIELGMSFSTPCCICKLSDIFKIMHNEYGWSLEMVKNVISLFSISPSGRWDELDERELDIDNHMRKTCFYYHPIIKIPLENDDCDIIWGYRSYAIMRIDFYNSIIRRRYPINSHEMKQWASHYNNLETKSFVSAVKNWFEKNTTFDVRKEIEIKLILNRSSHRIAYNFAEKRGDIDVAVCDKENNILYNIECKDIITPHSSTRYLYDSNDFTNIEDNDSYIHKHSMRDLWLKGHITDVRNYFEFSENPRIISLFMISHDFYYGDSEIPIISFSTLMREGLDCLNK